MIRSSVVPQTIASETAQKTNWKNHFASTVASESPITGKAVRGSPKFWRKNPVFPITSWNGPMLPFAPKANANPTAYHARAAIEKFIRIFATIVPAFLPRENPISRNAKPACMNMTSTPATTTQSVSTATVSPRVPFWAASSVSPRASCGAASDATTATGRAHSIFRLIAVFLSLPARYLPAAVAVC